jgi:uncharacterized protein (TIRG00374 family)
LRAIIGGISSIIDPAFPRRTIVRWIWRAILVAVLILAIWLVIIPQVQAARTAVLALNHISTQLLLLGLILELASIASYSALTLVTLHPRNRPNYSTLLRIDLATQGVNNSLPGGGPTSTAVKYRMLTLARTTPANALTGTTIEVSTSVLVLGVIFGVAIALSADDIRGNLAYVVAGIVIGGVAIIVAGAAILLARFREATLRRVGLLARRVPFLSEDAAIGFVDAIGELADAYRGSRRRMAAAIAWAAVNWLLDACALWVFLLAFGFTQNPAHLLVAYGLACLVGLVPITPGGLGVIEGVLIPALVGFGAPAGIAALGVISWRLVQYWLPMPLAVGAYASLRAGPFRPGRALPGRKLPVKTA